MMISRSRQHFLFHCFSFSSVFCSSPIQQSPDRCFRWWKVQLWIWTGPGICWGCRQPDCCHSGLGSPGDVAGFLLLFHTFDNFYPPFQFWSFLWDNQDKSNWNISHFKVKSLDWSFTVMSLLHQPQVFLKWDCDLQHYWQVRSASNLPSILSLITINCKWLDIFLHLLWRFDSLYF